MKLVEAAAAQLLHLVGQHRGGDDAAGFHILIQPVIGAWRARRESRRRVLAAMRSTPLKLVVGMMPGTMGMAMPARAASSRKRAVASLSKQNWPSARLAPASILAFSSCDVMAVTGRIRMALGIEGDADLERRDAADACDQFRRGAIAVADAADRVPSMPGMSPRSATIWRMPASQ